jgi:aspartate-semialdehyde dehydrogenase
MGFKIAIAGATGNVGREMLKFSPSAPSRSAKSSPLASSRSVGTEVSYGDKTLKVKALETYDFSDTDLCLMSAGGTSARNGRRRSPRRAASSSTIPRPGATTPTCR